MKFNTNAFLGCAFVFLAQLGFSQAPNVEWRKSYWAPTYPTSPHQPTPPNGPAGNQLPISQGQGGSSEDWFYFHAISKGTNNQPNGYICAGYSEFINYVENDNTGCLQYVSLGTGFGCDVFEAANYRKGNSKQAISLIDLNGNVQWYKTFSNGDLSNVIQTADGGYVAIGAGKSTEDGKGNLVAYNPTPGNTANYFVHGQADVGVTDQPRKIRIIKVDRNGQKVWEYMYGMEPYVGNGSAAFARTSRTTGGSAGGGIIETSTGDILFTAAADFLVPPPNSQYKRRTCVIKISSTGMLLWNKYYGSISLNSYGTAIAKTGTGASENFYVAASEHISGSLQQAFLFKLDNSNYPNPLWISYHSSSNPNANEGSRSGSTLSVNTAGELIVPVTHNVVSSGYFGYIAEALVCRVSASSGADISCTNFGQISAYDLTVGTTATADGGFAVVSSTRRNYNASNPDYFFPNQSQNPLDPNDPNNISPCNYSGLRPMYVDYGFNDAYVAKCNAIGSIEWENIFDSNTNRQTGSPNTWAYPDPRRLYATNPQHSDLKRTECLYTIVQSPDGGYVVAGNNSENFDDCYVAKLFSTCTNVTLANLTINTAAPSVYAATNSITASGVVIPSGPGLVTFKAGNFIDLLPVFDANLGSYFYGYIDPSTDCTPNGYRKANIINENITAKNKLEQSSLEIFPNPNNGVFTVKMQSEGVKSVYVYNLIGSLILEKIAFADQQFNIDITNYPKGLYFVKVVEGDKVKSAKVIHQ